MIEEGRNEREDERKEGEEGNTNIKDGEKKRNGGEGR